MADVTDEDVLWAMRLYGGNFAQKWAEAYYAADGNNQYRLRQAFSELWQNYRRLARERREHQRETSGEA